MKLMMAMEQRQSEIVTRSQDVIETLAGYLPNSLRPHPQGSLRFVGGRTYGSLDRVLPLWLFATLAAHQSIEGNRTCTIPPLCEECGRIHGCQFFRNCRRNELIYAHAISLGTALDFRSN